MKTEAEWAREQKVKAKKKKETQSAKKLREKEPTRARPTVVTKLARLTTQDESDRQ